jgi:hypothetical protein
MTSEDQLVISTMIVTGFSPVDYEGDYLRNVALRSLCAPIGRGLRIIAQLVIYLPVLVNVVKAGVASLIFVVQ